MFTGHTGEVKTLQSVVRQAVDKHKVKRVCIVADRALFSDNNSAFVEALKQEKDIGAEYVVSCPLKKLPVRIREKVFEFKKRQVGKEDFRAYYELFYKGRRVLVSYSETLRAREEKKRQRILEKLEDLCKKEGKIPASR